MIGPNIAGNEAAPSPILDRTRAILGRMSPRSAQEPHDNLAHITTGPDGARRPTMISGAT